MEVVAGRKFSAKSDNDCVIELLEEVLDRLKSGDLRADRCAIVVVDSGNVDTFDMTSFYHGRALENLGYVDIFKEVLRGDILR